MSTVKYGIVMPIYDIQSAVKFAVEAENAGWDGFFMADGMWGLDAWICLSAVAVQTHRIRLGTLLTPLSIMRPWKLASQSATLDNLSDGRVIVTIGMGAIDIGFSAFREEVDLRTRAERVDEGLDILFKLWLNDSFLHEGKHYQVDLRENVSSIPAPIQKPHIPTWVVAAWNRPKSMRRSLRCDGLIPVMKPKGGELHPVEPSDLREIQAWIHNQRNEDTPFDFVIEGLTSGDDEQSIAKIQMWQDAGMTWWIESLWDAPYDKRFERLKQGPPRVPNK